LIGSGFVVFTLEYHVKKLSSQLVHLTTGPVKKILLLTLFFAPLNILFAQTFSKEEVQKKLEKTTPKEKVEFITKNFYKIYSADFENASTLAREAIKLSRDNKWKDLEARSSVCLGVVSFLKGDYENALPHYNRGIDIFDSIQNNDGLAWAHNEVAVFFGKNKDLKRAYEHLALALKASTVTGNLEQQGTSYAHMATMKEREGKIKEATAMYQKVYQIRLQQKDSVGLGYILLDLAVSKQREGNLQGALDYIRQSTIIRTKTGDTQGLAVNLVNTGEAYMAFNRFDDAIQSFNAGLAAAIKIGYADLVGYTYDQLAQAYLQKNDFKSAYRSQSHAKAFSDSLFNLDRTRVLAEMQAKYEADKNQQQIVLQDLELSEQRAELERNFLIIVSLVVTLVLLFTVVVLIRNSAARKQELLRQEHEIALRDALIKASLESQEVERKRFAQDLHDGMGQLISSLRLAVSGIGKAATTEDRVHIFERSEKIMLEMYTEIRSIAFNLMPQTLIQHGIVAALEEMARRMNESGKIVVKVNSFDIPARLVEIQEISLYRIIQEWVNNIIKYSEATSIEVQLVGYEDEINVVIEDNGKGFDPAVLSQGKGNGWRNIQTRLNLIRSTLDIDSRPNVKGTTLVIHLPYRKAPIVEAMGEVLNTQ
jgi:signal transduction histidine kinase